MTSNPPRYLPRYPPRFYRRVQCGSSLIEVLGALAVAAFALSSFAYMATDAVDNSHAALTANALAEFNAGATRFVNTRYRQFYEPAGSRWSIGRGQTKQFRATDLLAESGVSFLPLGFTRITPTNQVPCLVVTKNANDQIEAYTYLTSPADARPLHTPLLRRIAAGLAGPNVGVIESVPGGATPAAEITAVSGAWRAPSAALIATLNATGTDLNFRGNNTCDGGGVQVGSHVAMVTLQGVGGLPGSATSGYLHREALIGRDDLNTMMTHLNMGGNNITATNVISALEMSLAKAGIVNEDSTCNAEENGLLRLMATLPAGTGPHVNVGHLGVCIRGRWQRPGSVDDIVHTPDTDSSYYTVPGMAGSNRGYQKVGQLYFQWGTQRLASIDNLRETFPIPFPNGCLHASINSIRSTQSIEAGDYASCDAQGFSYAGQSSNGISWFAVGY